MIRATRAATLAAAALAAMALGVSGAQATQVFSDNFNGLNGGVPADPYTAFPNFTVLGGSVSLNQGARCAGGSGGCVGLDGTALNGAEFQMTNGLHYSAGSLVTLTYDIAGNHHDCSVCAADDQYEAGFGFSKLSETLDHVTIDGVDDGTKVTPTGLIEFGDGFAVPLFAPYTSHTVSFIATDSGTVMARFRSFSSDGIGPLLDNVGLTVTGGVPEPASWALMILGFGATGAALRRRQTALAA